MLEDPYAPMYACTTAMAADVWVQPSTTQPKAGGTSNKHCHVQYHWLSHCRRQELCCYNAGQSVQVALPVGGHLKVCHALWDQQRRE